MNEALRVAAGMLAIGCAHGAPPAGGWTPSAEEDAVYRALSVRDGAPACAEVEALASDPVASLLAVVEHATRPPWAGVRAAACLISGHAEAVREPMLAWVTGPDTGGLARLVVGQLDAMPEPLAVELATAALAGPHADFLQKGVEGSAHPGVVALVSGDPADGERGAAEQTEEVPVP